MTREEYLFSGHIESSASSSDCRESGSMDGSAFTSQGDAASTNDRGHIADAGWSEGSALHESGGCKACLWVFSHGCDKGVNCAFCHIYHPRSARPRPSKVKRNRLKKLMASSSSQAPTEESTPNTQPETSLDGSSELPSGKFSL